MPRLAPEAGLFLPFGQEGVLRSALAAARRGRLAQAWLITGPPGMGKRTAARAMVAAQFCTAPTVDGDPCGCCAACAALVAGRHPDVHWTDAQGKLGVDEARAMARAAALRPDGVLSAFVVEACERLTGFAAAALLKTLEDPPGPALFLFLTEHPDRLEPTLRSRCQILRLRPVPVPVLAAWLRSRSEPAPTAEEADAVALASGGIVGRALGLLRPSAALGAPIGTAPDPSPGGANLGAALAATTLAEAVAAAAHLAERRTPVEEMLAVLRDLFLVRRRVLHLAGGPAGAMAGDALATLAPVWSDGALFAACQACAEAAEASAFHVNALLNWERLLLHLQRLRDAC